MKAYKLPRQDATANQRRKCKAASCCKFSRKFDQEPSKVQSSYINTTVRRKSQFSQIEADQLAAESTLKAMDDQESKHTPAHLASVFADILNPDSDSKIDVSKRSKKLERKRADSEASATKSGKRESKKRESDPSTTSSSSSKTERTKREWDNLNRAKPDPVLDRELERSLVRIATKGVVQLFNAIKEHQARVDQAVSQSGTTTVKMEKNVKSIVKKDKFLDLVSKSASQGEKKDGGRNLSETGAKSKVIKKEEEEDVEPPKKKWDVLRDDFLLNSAKDWDKEVD